MDTLVHADIFFFITSIAVIIFVFLISLVVYYVIGILRNLRDISNTLKRGVDNAEENIEEIYNTIEDSSIFRFIFGRRKKSFNRKQEKSKK